MEKDEGSICIPENESLHREGQLLSLFIHPKDKGSGRFPPVCKWALRRSEAGPGEDALLLLTTRRQQRAPCLPQLRLPSLSEESDLSQFLSIPSSCTSFLTP